MKREDTLSKIVKMLIESTYKMSKIINYIEKGGNVVKMLIESTYKMSKTISYNYKITIPKHFVRIK